ncbi:MAG TPA: ATP-binding cassette domain-containing protein, partial [Ignavibacteriales bacterium]|nr:ATP-binding cassette domain-containing protein [Ignavibacteriales bacterium]
MQDFINISNLTFTYENSAEPLFDSVSFQLHQGWTGFVGANGSGKTTLLKLITGALTPDSSGISFKGTSIYCEQRTDNMPGGLQQLLSAPDSSAYKLKEQLQLQDDWADRWNTLSHGERKRCQIACALYEEPDLLAIDEPSNHLDRHSKMFLFRALQSYRGVGLLVSHDRELLDGLCRNTIFVNPPDIDFRKCNYSTAEKEIETERERIARDYELAKRDIRKLKNRVAEERVKADNADRMRSKRDIDPKDRDAKGKINLARLTGRDGLAGKQHIKALSRLDSANEHKDS